MAKKTFTNLISNEFTGCLNFYKIQTIEKTSPKDKYQTIEKKSLTKPNKLFNFKISKRKIETQDFGRR